MTHIDLIPQGGLCNRLRAVLSALWLAEQGEGAVEVRVAWSVKAECAARLDQLFVPSSYTTPQFCVVPATWRDIPVSRSNLHLPALLRSPKYAAQWVNFRSERSSQHLLAELSALPRVYISTGYALCATPAQLWRRIKPLPHLQRQIDTLSAHFDAHTIGVHIRRTDNVLSIAHSDIAAYVRAMQHAIDSHSDVRFFLSTDDPQVRQQLMQQFPDRITAQHCGSTRSQLRGMEEAVVDLFTLARTSRLIGAYWSSFTDAAAEIGGLAVEIPQ